MLATKKLKLLNSWETVRFELLNTRICDLGLRVQGSPIEPYCQRLYDELHRTRTAAVLWGVKRGYCGYARVRVERCTELEPGVVALTFTRQSVLVLLSSLEIPVRPFGPDREPKARPGGGVALDNGQTGQIG